MSDEVKDVLGFPHDHEEIAWGHFLAQHVGKSYTEAFVTAFYTPYNTLDKALADMYTLRWLDTAIGQQLDGVGNIVGKPREVPNSVFLPFFGFISQPAGRAFGTYRMRLERDPYAVSGFLGDTEYRVAIKTKIVINNSHGTAEDIMRVVNDIMGVTKTAIFDMGNANAALMIDDMTITYADYRAEIIDEIIPRAGGVQIFPYLFDLTKTFGFSNQLIYFGFGVGILARMINSNIPPIAKTPKLSLDFMIPGTMPPQVTYTRAAGPATYFDVNGVMQTATTNQPRWDYDPVTHEYKGLLLEPASTNKLFPSVPATGHYLSSVTRIPNSGIAPDGTNTFVKMANTTANAFHGMQFIALAALGATQYTASCYVKRGEFRYVQFILDDQGGGTPASICTFDLQNGVISSGSAQNSIVHVGNGIYRCTLIMTATGAATTQVRLGINNATISNPSFYVPAYVGVEGEGTYIWGVQIEQGPNLTSYIPTTTAAVTRSLDVAVVQIPGMINPEAGTYMVEYSSRRTNPTPGGLSLGDFNNSIYFNTAAAGITAIATGMVGTNAFGVPLLSNGNVQRGAFVYQSNRLVGSSNGALGTTSILPPRLYPWTFNMAIGGAPWATYNSALGGHFRKLLYYDTAVTNAELQALTANPATELLPYEPDMAQPRQEQV